MVAASSGHVDSLVRLGVALHYRGRADEADERFREAMALAAAIGDPVLHARAAVGFGRRYPYWETDTSRITALEAALVELPAEETPLRTMLMGLLVTHLINGFRPDEASRRDALADELSIVLTAPDATTDVLLAVGQTRVYDCIEDPVALDGVADRLIAVAAAHSDLKVEATARFSRALAALDRGHMDVLRASTEHYADVSARLGDPRDQSQAATVRSTIAYIEGRYQEAAALSDEALELGRTSGDFNAGPHPLCPGPVAGDRSRSGCRGAAAVAGVDRVPGHRQLRRGHRPVRSVGGRPRRSGRASYPPRRNWFLGRAERGGLSDTHCVPGRHLGAHRRHCGRRDGR